MCIQYFVLILCHWRRLFSLARHCASAFAKRCRSSKKIPECCQTLAKRRNITDYGHIGSSLLSMPPATCQTPISEHKIRGMRIHNSRFLQTCQNFQSVLPLPPVVWIPSSSNLASAHATSASCLVVVAWRQQLVLWLRRSLQSFSVERSMFYCWV